MCIRDSVYPVRVVAPEIDAALASETAVVVGDPEAVSYTHLDTLLAIGEAKSGTTVVIDWLPESGTRLTVNGQVKGKDIAGEDFYKALLKIWLGNKPVQDDLKQALLGKAS